MVFIKTLQKNFENKKIFLFSCIWPSLSKKSYHIFIRRKFQNKKGFSMHFGFNNQFIKVMRTKSIFQKFKKKSFYFLLAFEITNLYVKRIPDIKKVFLLLT
jgi:hypothetical protein